MTEDSQVAALEQKQALEAKSRETMKDFLKTFIFPVLINKSVMFYFGLQYSNYPGEGYGYGLAATLVVMVIMIGRFIWKYKDIEDP
jgi:hypothetical protein